MKTFISFLENLSNINSEMRRDILANMQNAITWLTRLHRVYSGEDLLGEKEKLQEYISQMHKIYHYLVGVGLPVGWGHSFCSENSEQIKQKLDTILNKLSELMLRIDERQLSKIFINLNKWLGQSL